MLPCPSHSVPTPPIAAKAPPQDSFTAGNNNLQPAALGHRSSSPKSPSNSRNHCIVDEETTVWWLSSFSIALELLSDGPSLRSTKIISPITPLALLKLSDPTKESLIGASAATGSMKCL
ncbi:hypothetical protein Acr_09g0004130 [Actinidia rufa]|uniref:Uncharacterized protein n=1 Tax=Actinidia rufa TaxID=165716 RepID=A0A7J0F7R4_9ERIC|nr:hypothetical protein Acr_09g0004130 [Actinidia rufa]